MKLSEVVAQLQLILPKYTDFFSETISVNSIVASGGVATVNAPAHGMSDGNAITISDVAQETPIDAVSKDGLIFTFGTDIKHDLTHGYPGYETVTLGGFTDSAWNDSFDLKAVNARQSFNVQSVNSLPVLNGNEYILEKRIDGINGRYSVTVIDDDNFSVPGSFEDGSYLSGTVKTSVRIAGSVSIERSLQQYTKQDVGDLWAFVSMNDATVSKDRNTLNDADATFANGEDTRLRLIDGFSIFLVGNVSKEISGEKMIDVFRHDMLGPLLKSLSGVRFSTGLYNSGDFRTILLGHNFVLYDRAILVYQYNFQFTNDITIADQAENDDTRAFSEIDYTQTMGDGDTTDMTFNPDLPE